MSSTAKVQHLPRKLPAREVGLEAIRMSGGVIDSTDRNKVTYTRGGTTRKALLRQVSFDDFLYHERQGAKSITMDGLDELITINFDNHTTPNLADVCFIPAADATAAFQANIDNRLQANPSLAASAPLTVSFNSTIKPGYSSVGSGLIKKATNSLVVHLDKLDSKPAGEEPEADDVDDLIRRLKIAAARKMNASDVIVDLIYRF